MSATNQHIRDLLAVLDDRRHTLQQIYATTERALTREVAQLGRTSVSALIVAGLVENYYTCLETKSAAPRTESEAAKPVLTVTVYSLNSLNSLNSLSDAVRDLLDPRLIGGAGRLGAQDTRSVRVLGGAGSRA